MREPEKQMKDLNLGRFRQQSDRSEAAYVLQQTGAADGFSMEWMLDRFSEVPSHDGRQI
jgi:hypothetical protein